MNTALATWLKAYTHLQPGGDLSHLTDAMGGLADKQQAVRLLASPATQKAAQDVLAVALAAFMGADTARREHRRPISDEEADAVLGELAADGQRLFEAQLNDLDRRRDAT
jgi:hypothetical protein